LTGIFPVIAVALMKQKTATVADLRNNCRRVSAWLHNGESVEIFERRRSFTRLTPAAAAPEKPAKVNFKGQLHDTSPRRCIPARWSF